MISALVSICWLTPALRTPYDSVVHRRSIRPLLNLVVLMGVEVGALVFVQRLGAGAMRIDWSHLSSWLHTTSSEDAVAAVSRVLVLAGAYWLLATTALYLLARVARVPALVRGVGSFTVPGVRKLVDAALVVSIAGAGVIGGGAMAHAAAGPPPTTPPVVIQLGNQANQAAGVQPQVGDGHVYVPVPAGDPTPSRTAHKAGRHTSTVPSSTTSTSATPTTMSTDPSPPTPARSSSAPPAAAATAGTARGAAAAAETPTGSAESTRVVESGDNLWVIAAHHVADTTGRPLVRLGRGEIARYWVKVVEANRHKLPSGNPSLIHPGERVVLPAVGA
jgi:hypothetical protein